MLERYQGGRALANVTFLDLRFLKLRCTFITDADVFAGHKAVSRNTSHTDDT